MVRVFIEVRLVPLHVLEIVLERSHSCQRTNHTPDGNQENKTKLKRKEQIREIQKSNDALTCPSKVLEETNWELSSLAAMNYGTQNLC